jgi:phytanoyl-CoA hydroxylase
MAITAVAFDQPLVIPQHAEEDGSHFSIGTLETARDYYKAQGYVVLRGLLPAETCDAVRAGFDDIRPLRLPILRQKNMRYERNIFDEDGFLTNPIFNIQDLPTRHCGGFRQAALDLLTASPVIAAVTYLLDVDAAKLVQSMFFEAAAGTWPHQDSYYQDSATALGRCVAGWFALEDIDAAAGRFFVCPGSHCGPLVTNSGELDFATGHERYKEAMAETIRSGEMPLVAPFLAKGDVLFWNSLTVHGSLQRMRPGVSRASLTAHFLPRDDDMLQFHTRIRHQQLSQWNGVVVGMLHNQDEWRNRMIRHVATRFPRAYGAARQFALRTMMRSRPA